MLLIEISRGQQTMEYIAFMDNTLAGPKLRTKMEILGDALFKLGFGFNSEGGYFQLPADAATISSTAISNVEIMVYPFDGGPTITVGKVSPDRKWKHARFEYAKVTPELSIDDVKKWIGAT